MSGETRGHPILGQLVEKYQELDMCARDIERAYEEMCASYRGGGKAVICGNGGSAADSEHIAAELMKGMLATRPIPDHMREGLL
ncbi:MAG: SIS domain-containing protein [Chloroflexota bacterium]|nr:SIS domain-containing protein [Chloroflexota bacterium]